MKIYPKGKRDIRVLLGEVLRKINERETHQLFCIWMEAQNNTLGVCNVVGVLGVPFVTYSTSASRS